MTEWIDHDGKGMPVDGDCEVRPRRRNGMIDFRRKASRLSWEHTDSSYDIMAYQITYSPSPNSDRSQVAALGEAGERQEAGEMRKISSLIAELQETLDRFGDTCVYIRRGGLSWGAVALNWRDDDQKHGVFDLQAKHDRDMQARLEQVGRLIKDRNEWRDRALLAAAPPAPSPTITDEMVAISKLIDRCETLVNGVTMNDAEALRACAVTIAVALPDARAALTAALEAKQ